MARGNRGQQGPPRLWLNLSAVVVEKVGVGEWAVLVSATVDRGQRPADDVDVQFYVNGRTHDNPQHPNNNGRCEALPLILEEGNNVIEAQVIGTSVRARQILPLREDKPKVKIPKKLLVTFSGERSKQVLLISVSAEDGSLIQGFSGAVIDGGEVKRFKTGKFGYARYQMDISEKSRYVEVRAGNDPDLVWRADLLGPKQSQTQQGGDTNV